MSRRSSSLSFEDMAFRFSHPGIGTMCAYHHVHGLRRHVNIAGQFGI